MAHQLLNELRRTSDEDILNVENSEQQHSRLLEDKEASIIDRLWKPVDGFDTTQNSALHHAGLTTRKKENGLQQQCSHERILDIQLKGVKPRHCDNE